MFAYILVIIILCVLCLFEGEGEGSALPSKIATALLIIFAGLRYETGFDWVSYELYFDMTREIWSYEPQYVEPNLLVEPGFAIFNVIVKSLGFSFQGFLFSISLINMLTIYWIAKRYTNRVAFVLLIYFGFAFLAAQMAAIRQALSYSVLLLAFLRFDEGKKGSSYILSAIAVSIHTFTIALVPLVYIKSLKIPFQYVFVFVIVGIIAARSGLDIIPLIADNLLPFLGGGLIATKLELYGSSEGYTVSLASLALVPLHFVSYFFLTTNRFNDAASETRITYFAVWFTLLSLFAHSYFGLFPAFWNRVSYLTFLLQAIALTAKYRAYFRQPLVPFTSTAMAGAAALSITAYTLSRPSSLPFTPYQNVALVWVTGDYGDGRFRYSYSFQEAEREIAEKRR